MSVQSAICAWLEGDATLFDQLGTDALGKRMRALYAPVPADGEEYTPALTYQVLPGSSHEEYAIDGASYLEQFTIGFTVYATEYDTAHSIADALVNRMYAGVAQETDGRKILQVVFADRFDDDPGQALIEAGLYAVYVEFQIQIR